jgi:hypothetical protein
MTKKLINNRIHRNIGYPMEYGHAITRINPHRTVSDALPACGDPDEDVHQKYIFSFRGTTLSHPVRKRIAAALSGCDRALITPLDVVFGNHEDHDRIAYVKEIKQSKFVLCPRGTSPASFRQFEVMELARCPVIISDDWMPIPGIPWEEFAIFVREKDVGRIPRILAAREHEAGRLGQRAREIWENHFAPEPRGRHILDSVLDVWRNLQVEPFDVDAHLDSWRFFYLNGWTVPQRLSKRVKHELAGLTSRLHHKKAG